MLENSSETLTQSGWSSQLHMIKIPTAELVILIFLALLCSPTIYHQYLVSLTWVYPSEWVSECYNNIPVFCLIVLVLSHWAHPILSHWVSYQPRLFIAKCCCQPRWRPPTCWRWMWRWHKILMSEVAPSTAHQTLLYESSLRRTFSAPGPGMVLFSVPCGMPGNGSAIIHAHSSSRLIIWGPSDPSQIFT